MTVINEEHKSKYMAGNIRHLINTALQNELVNLPNTLAEIKDPIKRLELLTKLMPFVCAPIKQVCISTVRIETGENDMFSF